MASEGNTVFRIGVGSLPTSILELINISGLIANPCYGHEGAAVQLWT